MRTRMVMKDSRTAQAMLAVSASREFSALLGIPRSLVYSIAPISGIFIIIAQIINIYEDITGEKVDC